MLNYTKQKKGPHCLAFAIAIILPIMYTAAKNEHLYRLVDKNIVCDAMSVIENVTVHSLTNCAIACKMKAQCEMFSLDHVYRNKSISKPRMNKKMICSLCKSTNMTTIVDKRGWSTYMKWSTEIQFNILDTDHKPSSPVITALEIWDIDCNAPNVTSKKNGIIIGIWDDKDGFKGLDKVKCFNWGTAELFSEKPSRLLYIHLEDYRQCPKDYVLTAISASNSVFRTVDNGKCTPLAPEYSIEYEQCVTVVTENKDGGSIGKWRPWRVQCPTAGPMVAVSLHRRRRIHTGLKCCVLKGLLLE